ncbi:hypothetical protein QE152_g30651 [Popillia japonica]|uniref:DDE-1 domain-containing protein n=1 Tax=Popillia japonica TaxID=7064 RepID=A0AAW1JDF5_POPJA
MVAYILSRLIRCVIPLNTPLSVHVRRLNAELQLPVSTLRTILKNREEIKEKEVWREKSKKLQNAADIINIAAAWETIKPETIQNCFKKAGFRNNEVDVALEEEEPTILPETIQNCFKKAGFRNNEVDVALEEEEPTILQGFTGYASFEDNVATYEIRSIENLIEDVNNTPGFYWICFL